MTGGRPAGHPWRGAVIFAGVALLLVGCSPAAQEASAPPPGPTWRLLPAQAMTAPSNLLVTVRMADPEALARTAEALEARHGARVVTEWPIAVLNIHCFILQMTVPPTAATIDRLVADPDVRTVQRMNRFTTQAATGPIATAAYNLDAIGARQAHAFSTGAGVRIAVVDTGVDFSHPDLDADGTVFQDFVIAGGPALGETHGTAVAGVIGARAGTTGGAPGGVLGVAPGALLMGLRGCWQEGSASAGVCTTFSLTRAIGYAIRNRADVINLSIAGPEDPLIGELLDLAAAQRIIVVAAQGDVGAGPFPASRPEVIAARAASAGPAPATSAVPAPGEDVVSTIPGGGYDLFSGSSIAAAHLSGVAALLRGVRAEMTPAEVRAVLAMTARRPGRDMVDACDAVVAALGSGSCDAD